MLSQGIFPAPTNGTQFQGSPSTPTDVREEIVRIDHEFNSKNSIFGHWISEQVGQGFGTTIWSGDNVPTIGSSFNNPSYSAVVHYTTIINPRLLNEVAFNYNGNRIAIQPVGVFAAPSAFAFNRVFTGPNELDRMPSVQLSGSTGTNYQSNWMPWNNKADSYQFTDDVSWTKGTHQLKIGGMLLMYRRFRTCLRLLKGRSSLMVRTLGTTLRTSCLVLQTSTARTHFRTQVTGTKMPTHCTFRTTGAQPAG